MVELLIREVAKRLSERSIKLNVTPEAKAWLVKRGYDQIYGARPLRRAIQRYVENPISSKILQSEFKEGDTITVDVREDNLTFTAS